MADWRHQAGKPKPPASNPAAGASRRSWQPGPAVPVPAKTTSRSTKFLLAAGFVGLLLAGVVLVILLWKPARFPEVLIIASPTGSAAGLDNTPGVSAAQGLQDWLKAGTDRPRLAANLADTADRDAWKGKLNASARLLVLYFAAPGGAGPQGPFLWFTPADASSPSESQQLPVREILDRLAGLPAAQPKLVIFDLPPTPVSWAHGSFFPDFARALKELDGEIARVENLAVICSCDADQTAWSSDEWRRTVFGQFMLAGLMGSAGKSAGDRITGASLFEYVRGEVERWAAVNRDEKQTPILLPAAGGSERAGKIELAIRPEVPASPSPTGLAAPEKPPAELERQWEIAEDLARRNPAPDTLDPVRYREYLETLLRWEHQIRLGQPTEAAAARARVLSQQLGEIDPASDPVCRSAGLSVGPGLGFPAAAPNPEAFRRLWSLPKETSRASEWAKELGTQNETNFRLSISWHLVEELIRTGKYDDLLAADRLLTDAVDGTKVGTAETHFIRMLARHLDPVNRPNEAFLRQAVRIRKEAEEAAWLAGSAPGVHPYPERVFPWIAAEIAQGDRHRRLGEDCLFDASPDSWAEAVKYFGDANAAYKKARETGRVIASALCARDEILCRLPYYARWLAEYRGRMPDAEVVKLLNLCETIAGHAHQIALLAQEPKPERIPTLDSLTVQCVRDLALVRDAHTAEVKSLSNTVHPSNWHAIHGALRVPFIPARDRIRLLGDLRKISFDLAPMTSQPTGTSPPPLPVATRAARNARMAQALLGNRSPELAALIANPQPGAWWVSLREASARLGAEFRGVHSRAQEQIAKAAATPTLRESGPHRMQAAHLARVADPAAPVLGSESPIAAERNFFRHYLLLEQARRTIEDGWADVGPPMKPELWYCVRAARLYTESARPLVRGNDANPAPQELERRFADVRREEARMPVELTVHVPATREIADERQWKMEYTIARKPGDAVGFPVTWLETPNEPYHVRDPALNARRRIAKFVLSNDNAEDLAGTFQAKAQPGEIAKPGEMTTTVLYRGHLYRAKTDILLAGNPSLDWNYTPPKGDAAFAVLLDAEAVSGAVTILFDMTASMTRPKENPKINEALRGVQKLLANIPPNTLLTVVTFYGDEKKENLTVLTVVPPFRFAGSATDIENVMKILRSMKPDGDSTPIARAIQEVLSETSQAKYWPGKFSGDRSLIVITDGADNWDSAETVSKQLIRAMTGTKDPVNVHITFFGVDKVTKDAKTGKTEAELAEEQFRAVGDPRSFLTADRPREPARLWFDVNDGDRLASNLTGAVLPRITFEDAQGVTRRFPVTLPNSAIISPSPRMKPGTYKLYGMGASQSLQLDPGDRVLLRGKLKDDKLELATFPLAHELAKTANLPAGSGNALHLTIPQVKIESPSRGYNVRLMATMEPAGVKAAERLQAAKPAHFAWFDIHGGDPNRPTTVRIGNAPSLNAPAWKIDLLNWDSTAADRIRKPAVHGHWIDGVPPSVASFSINLKSPKAFLSTAPKVIDQQGVTVEVVDASVETWKDDTHPEGAYLIVSLRYSDPANKVFLRPTTLHGVSQRHTLHERHVWYDPLKRYTARFGPLTDDDLKAEDFVLYAAGSLRKWAADQGKSASAGFADRELTEFSMPSRLIKLLND